MCAYLHTIIAHTLTYGHVKVSIVYENTHLCPVCPPLTSFCICKYVHNSVMITALVLREWTLQFTEKQGLGKSDGDDYCFECQWLNAGSLLSKW